MNKNIYTYSESLVLSLCTEIEYIKSRSNNIKNCLRSCKNKELSERLLTELNKLNNIRLKIKNVSESLSKSNCNDLSIEFLLEITRRCPSLQQI